MSCFIHKCCSITMVNKFGETTTRGDKRLKDLILVKKIVVTSGKFIDYYDEIQNSIRLGFNPYYIAPEKSPFILFTYDKQIHGIGSAQHVSRRVTNDAITTNHYLVYCNARIRRSTWRGW